VSGVEPKVAPFESCTSCLRGDTTTVMVLVGSAEWLVSGLNRGAGIPMEEALQMVRFLAEDKYGCEPGDVLPWMRMDLRLCTECAAKTGGSVAEVADILAGVPYPAYTEPGGEQA
jgi:hypothetical protein